MTKQEKIQEEWIKAVGVELWNFIINNSYLRNNGFIDGELICLNHIRKLLYFSNNLDIKLIDETQFIRPLTLKGIENNNGWIKIESENDLPKEKGVFLIYHITGSSEIYSGNMNLSNLKNYTHYQSITEPREPLY